jgi:TATA-box binding protein (TBP) (component of TFIID and TFIIIB)
MQPEQFPALIYRSDTGTFLIFPSGKIYIVGAKNEKQAKASMKKLISLTKLASFLDYRL